MSDLVIVSKSEIVALLDNIGIEHFAGEPYVTNITEVRHALDQATSVSGEVQCYGNWNYDFKRLSAYDGVPEISFTKTIFYNLPLYTTPQPAIPEGYALAPIEPTDKILSSAKHWIPEIIARAVYKAMITEAMKGE